MKLALFILGAVSFSLWLANSINERATTLSVIRTSVMLLISTAIMVLGVVL